jgi:hypothetical protein
VANGGSRRRIDRSEFDDHVRIGLLETDMDDHERSLGRVYDELRKIRNLATTILVALATSAVMFAINLITGHSGVTP